jgi:hypothetical protein
MNSILVSPTNRNEFLLVKELLNRMNISHKSLSPDSDDLEEHKEWVQFGMSNLERAYADDEPEYTSSMVKEPNPEYKIG